MAKLLANPTVPKAPSVISARPSSVGPSIARPASRAAQQPTPLHFAAPEFIPASAQPERLTVPAPEKEQQCAPAVPVESCASYTADSPTGADFPSTLGGHSGAPSTTGYNPLLAKDQNSVTIKANTSVKDSAGAIMKVLERLSSTVVTALKQEPGHEALNRAVKALAVCRKYLTDTNPGMELTFLPVQRTDCWGRLDPELFSFLAFKSLIQPEAASTSASQPAPESSPAAAETEIHVSSTCDIHTLGSTLVRNVIEHGKAVMKAGGGRALFVAMAAVVQARQHLKAYCMMDVALVPQWITEDTRAKLGRESKFVQFLVLPAGLHGVAAGDPAAPRQPAFAPLCAAAAAP